MKTILITGINGFLGSNLAKTLHKQNVIIGLENSSENLNRLKEYDFKIYNSQEVSLNTIFIENEIDIVIHAATIYNSTSVETLLTTNLLLPLRLLELLENNNGVAFINTDSFFNNPEYDYKYLGEYTLSKRNCLEWLKKLHTQTKLINLKIYHMYGPADSPHKFVPKILSELKNNKPAIELTPGKQMRDFVYITDVVNAYDKVISQLSIIKESFKEYQVGTGKASTLKYFVETAAHILKSTTQLNFGALNYREGEIMFSQADTTSLKEIGWNSKFSVKSGLEKYLKN